MLGIGVGCITYKLQNYFYKTNDFAYESGFANDIPNHVPNELRLRIPCPILTISERYPISESEEVHEITEEGQIFVNIYRDGEFYKRIVIKDPKDLEELVAFREANREYLASL